MRLGETGKTGETRETKKTVRDRESTDTGGDKETWRGDSKTQKRQGKQGKTRDTIGDRGDIRKQRRLGRETVGKYVTGKYNSFVIE